MINALENGPVAQQSHIQSENAELRGLSKHEKLIIKLNLENNYRKKDIRQSA